jgi:hypothetical protein
MASNVPLTIQTVQNSNNDGTIVIGSNTLNLSYSTYSNVYWAVVLDRSDLSVKANFTFSDNSNVPSQLQPFLGNTQYVLILTTQSLSTTNLPQGALYSFLTSEGAGTELKRIEQIYEALNCGTWGWVNYCFVGVLGNANTISFEYSSYENTLLSTLYFFPVGFGSGVLYTPAEL